MAEGSFSSRHPALVYGAVTGVVIFFVGYVTGMGGGLLSNIVFGALMGVFAGVCYRVAVQFAGRDK